MSIFNTVLASKPKRTAFNLSHEVKTSAKFGVMTPVLCQEVLPSDKWKISTESFTRFAPTLAPLMQRINTFQHYFFVPNRILWRGWERFISPSEMDDSRPITPSLTFDGANDDTEKVSVATLNQFKGRLCAESNLLDYMGINISNLSSASNADFYSCGISFSLMPLFAYNLIWLEYFADENQYDVRGLRDSMLDFADLGNVKTSEITTEQVEFLEWLISPKLRAWEKDYFTSALPNTQRGAEITIGDSQSVNFPKMVVHTGQDIHGSTSGAAEAQVRIAVKDDDDTVNAEPGTAISVGSGGALYELDPDFTVGDQIRVKGPVTFQGEVMTLDGTPIEEKTVPVNPVTINELRRAVRLQEFLEKSMRGGYRLIEQIKSHFGVTSSDARLDRPQFLGGDMQKVIVSEISSTADTFVPSSDSKSSSSESGSILGEYSGHLTEVGNTKRRTFFSEEHGWIICLYSCTPRSSYCQGLPRQFTRFDWLDYAWPEFAHLGEQEVLKKELYLDKSSNNNEAVFGYQSRYAEYKTIPSQIHGAFKNTLSYWTMARRFSSVPSLSPEFRFVQPDDGSITDAFTVQDGSTDYLFLNLYHKITCIRPLPRFGVPML